jgi:hypothetical protein
MNVNQLMKKNNIARSMDAGLNDPPGASLRHEQEDPQ